MSFSHPSQVSATTGSDQQAPVTSCGPCATRQAITASRTTPTLWVLVIMTGSFEETGLLDPGGTGHLAVAVLGEPAGEGEALDRVKAARQDRRDAGAHRALANHKLARSRG